VVLDAMTRPGNLHMVPGFSSDIGTQLSNVAINVYDKAAEER